MPTYEFRFEYDVPDQEAAETMVADIRKAAPAATNISFRAVTP